MDPAKQSTSAPGISSSQGTLTHLVTLLSTGAQDNRLPSKQQVEPRDLHLR